MANPITPKKRAKSEFPDVIYLVREEDGDEHYYLTYENVEDIEDNYRGERIATFTLLDIKTLAVTKQLKPL